MSMPPFDFPGTALVTGAASGIGEHLARGLARRGADLVILDCDAEGLAVVEADLRAEHPERAVDSILLDVADRAALLTVAGRIAEQHPDLSLLVNNAGVALGGRFQHLTLEEFDWVMAVNFAAPVALTHALLPTLLANTGSHLVFLSSVFGLFGPPGQSAYSSSKFAVRGFAEVLRAELAEQQVGVTTVHPGGVRTRIAERARVGANVPPEEEQAGREEFRALLTYPPERAAEEILDGVHRRQHRVLVTSQARLIDVLARATPTHHPLLLDRLVRLSARTARVLPR